MLLRRYGRRLARAGLYYGHGTDNPHDDAAAIVCHVLAISLPLSPRLLQRRPAGKFVAAMAALVERRIALRIPVVYLTNECWFAGVPFYVDERVLIPRSPLAELIESRFAPWVDPDKVRRVLDVGTGSGCIAIAAALALPRARVDAVDISADALAVAAINRRRHGLARRVRLLQSDYFSALEGPPYDIIVSNPPYVGTAEYKSLPAEYGHEPESALRAGRDGMDAVRVLLREARQYLKSDGILIVEVGNTERTVRRRYRDWPFVWLAFARGGGGVFLLKAADLEKMSGSLSGVG
ncbi:MAG: 50S ribosomal protein L3 N(5)-glutamine methyltransferase [Pseudomonadota bacterium]